MRNVNQSENVIPLNDANLKFCIVVQLNSYCKFFQSGLIQQPPALNHRFVLCLEIDRGSLYDSDNN
jgi:hypothetical protein